jgi:hypothetical protein
MLRRRRRGRALRWVGIGATRGGTEDTGATRGSVGGVPMEEIGKGGTTKGTVESSSKRESSSVRE